MNIFVSKNDTFKVEVLVYEEEGKINATVDSKEVPDKAEVEIINFTFRKPNHGDSTELMSNSEASFTGNKTSFDFMKLQDQVLKNLLVDWSVKDEKGESLGINNKNINSLNPQITRAAALGCLAEINL